MPPTVPAATKTACGRIAARQSSTSACRLRSTASRAAVTVSQPSVARRRSSAFPTMPRWPATQTRLPSRRTWRGLRPRSFSCCPHETVPVRVPARDAVSLRRGRRPRVRLRGVGPARGPAVKSRRAARRRRDEAVVVDAVVGHRPPVTQQGSGRHSRRCRGCATVDWRAGPATDGTTPGRVAPTDSRGS